MFDTTCSETSPTRQRDAAPHTPIDWRDIPVFIVNRNRCDALRCLVDWLLAAGTRRVVILDNASNYPPLLAYYEALPALYDGAAKLLRFEENHGPYVLWQQQIHTVLDTPFVLTDSDVVPAAGCPQDLIGRLHAALARWPDAGKVGCALRIDDLPDGYVEADTVRKWESQFWEHPVAPGVYAAPIDTTFALYPAFAEFSNAPNNLRLGWPCVAEHTPWYAEEHALSDEERHYREHTSATFSNWSVAKKDSWVRRSERVAAFEARAQVLHMDGGRQYIPGWINAVPPSASGAMRDIGFDPTRAAEAPLPLADDSLDGIHISHALDPVRDLPALMQELWRCAKPGAKLQVRVMQGQGVDGPARAFGESSLAFLAQPVLGEGSLLDYRADWQLDGVRAVSDGLAHHDPMPQELVVTLTAVKPARARAALRPAPIEVERTQDARVDPAFERCAVPPPEHIAPIATTPMVTPPARVRKLPMAVRERIYIYTDNHRNSPGIGDMVRFVKLALEDCGYEVRLTHRMALGALHVVFEGFVESEDMAPLIEARAQGTRFILIGTEPIVGGNFNGGIDTRHWHYGNIDYWSKRFDHFRLAVTMADAVWVLAESMVETYRAALPEMPIAFLPHGYVNGFALFEHLPEAQKDIDFYFSGTLTRSRRDLLEALGRSYCVVHTDQSTGEYLRHDYIARSKVCLSLRLSENNVIPSVSRMHFHLQHKSFVLHEAYPLPCPLDPYFLHVPRDEFLEWAHEAIRSDRRRAMAEAAFDRFRAEQPMTQVMPALLEAVFNASAGCAKIAA